MRADALLAIVACRLALDVGAARILVMCWRELHVPRHGLNPDSSPTSHVHLVYVMFPPQTDPAAEAPPQPQGTPPSGASAAQDAAQPAVPFASDVRSSEKDTGDQGEDSVHMQASSASADDSWMGVRQEGHVCVCVGEGAKVVRCR